MTAHAPQAPPRGARALFVVGVVLLTLNVVTVLSLWLHRRHAEARAREKRAENVGRGLRVAVAKVAMSGTDREITLPADVRAFQQTTLYAKVGGYIRTIDAERGQRVRAGQLLATLVSPETERDVASARSDWLLKKRNADRARALGPPGVLAQQDVESATTQEKLAAENLARAESIRAYTELRAPFEGVVTARYVDLGALLPPATIGVGSAVVDLADVDTLRIFFYVGQDVAPFVRTGDRVELWQDELRKEIPAEVTRTAGALDPRTRTMQVEVLLDNRSWQLLPGTFARARLHVRVEPAPTIPAGALVFRDGATHVAVVEDGRARLVPVTLGASDGRSVRVVAGLKGGETVAVNVPVELSDGAAVQPGP